MVDKETIFKALIIYRMVDKDYLSKEQLSGINDFLENFTLDTLKVIADDMDIDYNA